MFKGMVIYQKIASFSSKQMTFLLFSAFPGLRIKCCQVVEISHAVIHLSPVDLSLIDGQRINRKAGSGSPDTNPVFPAQLPNAG